MENPKMIVQRINWKILTLDIQEDITMQKENKSKTRKRPIGC